MKKPMAAHDPTIYHYTLKRKIALRPEGKISYLITALMAIAALYFIYGLRGLVYTFVGLATMLVVHALVMRITLRRVDKIAEKRWAFRRDWPWIGPLPVQDTQLALFRRLHFHLLLVGCCVAGLLYPWAHPSLVVALLYWHVWLLAPRYRLLMSLWRERGDGVLRLEASTVFYYHQ